MEKDIRLSKKEQETIISFNAGEKTATVYTRDKAVIRRFDTLVNEFPNVYRLVDSTDIDRTYIMPKEYVSYRRPRNLSVAQREAARCRMLQINRTRQEYTSTIRENRRFACS